MADSERYPLSRNPNVLWGAVVFKGTRVPVDTLFDTLVSGDSLNQFLVDYPTVSREQAVAALDLASQQLGRLTYETTVR